MSAMIFSGSATMTAQDFAATARIGTVLPATGVSGGFSATLPTLAGGSASHLISAAAAAGAGGGVHVLTHVS